MRQPQFMRSNTFHWAFMVAGVFAVFVTVLFGFISWKIDDYLTARSDRVITAQMDGIAGLPPDRRLEAIDERLEQDPRGVQLAAIFAAGITASPAISRACRRICGSTPRRNAPTSSGRIETAESARSSARSADACKTATCW
jgi:hypothetical protein